MPRAGGGVVDFRTWANVETHTGRYLSCHSRIHLLSNKHYKDHLEAQQRATPVLLCDKDVFNMGDAGANVDEAHIGDSPSAAENCSGRDKLMAYRRALRIINEHKFALSEQQLEIIDCYLQSSLQQMFGDELIAELPYLMEMFDLSEIYEEVIVMMKRRGGKTVVTAAHIAIMIVTQPRANSNIYSSSSRVSELLKSLVVDMVEVLIVHGFNTAKISKNSGEVLFIDTPYGTRNEAYFYPCNVEIGAAANLAYSISHLYPYAYIPSTFLGGSGSAWNGRHAMNGNLGMSMILIFDIVRTTHSRGIRNSNHCYVHKSIVHRAS